jgi:hypothetical protein
MAKIVLNCSHNIDLGLGSVGTFTHLEDSWNVFGFGSDDVTLRHGPHVEHFAAKNEFERVFETLT